MTTQFIIIQITPFFKNNSIKSLSEKVDRTNKTVLSVRKTRTSGEGNETKPRIMYLMQISFNLSDE